jgi:CRISPR-associated protein Csd1
VLERSAWGGTAHHLREKLDSVMEKAGVIPGRLNPEQQAEFILGYHHQRARDAHERRERRAKRDNGGTA